MSNTDSLKFNKPGLFSPTTIRNVVNDVNGVTQFQQSDFSESDLTALGESGSFKYSLMGDGIRSTQQLNISWSQFEAHTFFNSARVKTQVAFDKIINQFPFDGTQKDHELFMDGLTGFEKYVYDQFPKHTGYLFFSGTNGQATGGTYVVVKDTAGANFPTLSRNLSGNSFLDPGAESMTIEFKLFIPTVANNEMVVLQKLSGSTPYNQFGFSCVVFAEPGTTTDPELVWAIYSGSSGVASLHATGLVKGQFNDVVLKWDRTPGVNKAISYVNGQMGTTSSGVEMGLLNISSSNLIIGSGSSVDFSTYFTGFGIIPTSIAPTDTLTGSIDELRIWHSLRSQDQLNEYNKKSVFASDDLRLYFKFNEPSGSNTNLIIDSSGNSLHGILTGSFSATTLRNRATSSIGGTSPMTYEKLSAHPILFPDQVDVDDLRTTMLAQATEFDASNPNIITNLVPRHYLLEGQLQDGTSTEEGPIVDSYSSEGLPMTHKLGDTQLLLSLLWTWAKFFDEIKLYTQAFGDLYSVDYDPADTVPDQFLHFLASRYGIKLPPMFNGTTIPQFVDAENLSNSIGTGTYSLQYLQNQIWRRILINLRDVLTSKGTIHSVKSFIRSVGIDPDNNFRIREFGGPTVKSLNISRESRSEISTMIDFISGGFLQSGYLTSSRNEPGFPKVDPTIRNGVNLSPNGLWTSGSWTYEGIYKFELNRHYNASQSLVRMEGTGSAFGWNPIVLTNLIAYSGSDRLRLCVFPQIDQDISLSLSLTGVDIFDGNYWNVSFGRYRGDDTENLELTSSVSSSYFLRAAKQSFGEIIEQYVTSSFFWDEKGTGNFFNYKDNSYNKSGSYLTIGSQSIPAANWNAPASSDVMVHNFQGKVSQIRFWSKGLKETEWREHVRNFKSIGVEDPLTNFNFNSATSGSFQRLRMDVSTDQPVTASDSSGVIRLTDFAQNNIGMSGSSFPATSSVIVPQRFFYSHISPKFDESATTNKIRARSYSNFNNISDSDLSSNYINVAPVYELVRSEAPTDNTRFTIDFSVIDALNQDIVGIFSTLDSLDNIIGNPELIFSNDYPKLEEMRNLYFNRLTDKVNLKGFFEFFKWFDSNIGSFIAQLVPRKTKYLGTNFVVESHMLERPKMEYFYSDIYIGENHRHSQKDTILLQEFLGMVGRF